MGRNKRPEITSALQRSRRPLLFVFTTLVSIHIAPALAEDDGGSMTNNLLADLAPIVALFGEQVTKQFLSQSMTWLDCFIFALCPIGIITAIVSAIRVSAPNIWKCIIGRARESPAVAELELLSSTSGEVCELWSGQAIVRVMGSPEILEVIFVKELKDKASCGLFTLSEAKGTQLGLGWRNKPDGTLSFSGQLERFFVIGRRRPNAAAGPTGYSELEGLALSVSRLLEQFSGTGRRRRSAAAGPTGDSELEGQGNPSSSGSEPPASGGARDRDSPNISLNLGSPKEKLFFLVVATLFGYAVQFGVLFFTTTLPRGDELWAVFLVGTILLMSGMFICALVIEQSTYEETWKRECPDSSSPGVSDPSGRQTEQDAGSASQKFQMLWLQRGGVVNDQAFKSYAIFAPFPRDRLVTSRRIKESTYPAFLRRARRGSIIGSIITLVGFVLQFSGLRMLHWSVTVAQFTGMAIMTGLRAWMRADLARRPIDKPVDGGHEMDWLALALAAKGDDLWPPPGERPIYEDYTWAADASGDLNGCRLTSHSMPKEGGQPEGCGEPMEGGEQNQAQRILEIRTRLGKLSNWSGGSPELVKSVATAIGAVTNALFAQEKDKKLVFTINVNLMVYQNGWKCPAELESGTLPVKFTIDIDKDTGLWKANAEEIEAALSLWLYSGSQGRKYERSEKRDGDDSLQRGIEVPGTKSIRLLGKYTAVSRRDLTWWGGSAASRLLVLDAGGDTTATNRDSSNQGAPSEDTPGNGIPGGDIPKRDTPSQDTSNGDSTAAGKDTAAMQEIPATSGDREVAAVEISVDHVVGSRHCRADVASANGGGNQHPDFRGAKFKVLEGGLKRDPADHALLALPSTGPVEKVYAQEFFSSFIWAVANGLEDPIKDLNTTSRESTSATNADTPLLSFRLESPALQAIVQNVHQAGLATTDEAYMLVVLPLSVKGRLPEPLAVIEPVRERMRGYERAERWVGVGKVFKELSAMSRTCGDSSSVYQKTAAVLEDLLRTLHVTIWVWKGQNRSRQEFATLERLERELQKERKSFSEKVISGLEEVDRLHQPQAFRGPEGSTSDSIDNCLDKELGFVQHAHLCLKAITDIENLEEPLLRPRDIDGLPGGGEQLGARQKSIMDLIDNIGGVDVKDIFGWTLLHYAVARKSKTAIQDLLVAGADANSTDTKGWTPLHWAAKNGNLEAVSQILDYDADIDVEGRDGMRPLHCAANSNGEIVSRLLGAGAGITKRDSFRRTPLHWAADLGRADIVDILLAKGAPINAEDNYRRTPLQLAVSKGYKEVVNTLLDQGAENDKGKTSK